MLFLDLFAVRLANPEGTTVPDEKYLKLHPDSEAEFLAKQQHWAKTGEMVTQAGFPQGSFGEYHPFSHPATGEPFHARDTFDATALGYGFDVLPEPLPDQSMDLKESASLRPSASCLRTAVPCC